MASPSVVDPLLDAPAFDVRRIRTEPHSAGAEERPCDVAFAEDARPLEEAEAAFYPSGTVVHQVVRCAAPSGGGWVELAFADSEGTAGVGTRIAIRPSPITRGRQGYAVVSFVRLVGDAHPTEAAPETSSITLGFDFGRLQNEPALVGRPQRCAVDFVSDLVLLDDRTRRRSGYPAGTQNRLSAKCLHEGGDSWIDVIFSEEDAANALSVTPGVEITVEIESVDGGFAGRPMVRLTAAP